MTNREIEENLKRAFTNAAPDVFDSILADCGSQKGVINMPERKSTNKWFKRAVGIAAALILTAGGIFGFGAYRVNYAVDSTISLDVNPAIEITVNQKERVLDIVPLNEDGKIVLGDMDLKGSDLEVSVNALLGSMLKNGYLSDIANSILVSVDNSDPAKSAEMQARLADEINYLLNTDTFSGAVLSQTIQQDSDTRELAEQYGITLGKAQLIRQIVGQSPRYTFADLVPLSINELNLISGSGSIKLDNVESVGTASDKGYIGNDAAKNAALKHAGVDAADIGLYNCEMDYEHGKMVYEIEFTCGGYEYDYDIDALTGEVVSNQKETDDDYIAPNTGSTGNGNASTGNSGSGNGGSNSSTGAAEIDVSAAKSAAFAHAGIAESGAANVKCELEHENGGTFYEIEFEYGGYEYDYIIDASTGEVIRSQKEADDDYIAPNAGNAGNGGAGTGAALIDPSAAKSAAFAHAGIAESSAANVKCEQERDDGKIIYEIEFDYGGREYSYEIDASSGSILKYEIDD